MIRLAALAVLILTASGCAVVDFLDGKHLRDRQDYRDSYGGSSYSGGGNYGSGGHGGHSH